MIFMKKLIGLVLIIVGSSALASKARYTALGKAEHLTDTQTMFSIPSDIMLLPEAMEFNFGSNAVGQNTDGGMMKAMGEARVGFFLGAMDAARGSGYLGVENPFTILYGAKAGDMNWGVGFTYAASDKKMTALATDDQNQSFMKLTGSVGMGDTTVALDLGLADKAKGNTTNETYEMTNAPMNLAAYHKVSDWTVYGKYESNTNKLKETAEVKTTESTITLGGVHAMKKEGADFFYGFAYRMMNQKAGDVKTQETTMPFILGIEADAASWLTLRGSVTQNVLLGGEKVTGNATPTGMDSVDHNTTVNAGMGFKFTKSVIDITLTAANTGAINGSSFGANAGMTYLF